MSQQIEFRESALIRSVAALERAGDILLSKVGSVNRKGRKTLESAYLHLYGALVADFVRDAEQPDWIGPKVQGPKSATPTREFLMDHLFDELFAPLRKRPSGDAFLLEVKYRALKILEYREMPVA